MCGCLVAEGFGAHLLADYPRQGGDRAQKQMSSECVAMRTVGLRLVSEAEQGGSCTEWEQTRGWIQTKIGATQREQRIGSEGSLNQNEISAVSTQERGPGGW